MGDPAQGSVDDSKTSQPHLELLIYFHCVAGVLLELGLEKEHVTRQRVEQYVLKLDAEAQTKFKCFLQNSFQNPHTLFVLIHDHAHWDLVRLDWLRRRGGLAFPLFE